MADENTPIIASLTGDWQAVAESAKPIIKHGAAYLLAEAADPLIKPRLERIEAFPFDISPQGRVFNNKAEIRWRRRDNGGFIITYLSEVEDPPVGFKKIENLGKWRYQSSGQKLYGKWSDATRRWAEIRIPGAGDYQVLLDASDHPYSFKLITIDYFYRGNVQLTRFCEVKAYE